APVYVPSGFAPTPVAGSPVVIPTPPPGTLALEVSGAGLTAVLDSVDKDALPRSARAVSLAEAPPVPRRWYVIGAIVFGALVVLAIVLAISAKLSKSSPEPAPPEPAKPPKPASTVPAQKPTPPPPPP